MTMRKTFLLFTFLLIGLTGVMPLANAAGEKIDIPESRKEDFRRELMNHIGAIAIEGKTFNYKSNDRLKKALELKLFEDQKDQVKFSSLVAKVVDKETQAKIDVIKARLMEKYGYCEQCANDTLQYVSNLMAKGDES